MIMILFCFTKSIILAQKYDQTCIIGRGLSISYDFLLLLRLLISVLTFSFVWITPPWNGVNSRVIASTFVINPLPLIRFVFRTQQSSNYGLLMSFMWLIGTHKVKNVVNVYWVLFWEIKMFGIVTLVVMCLVLYILYSFFDCMIDRKFHHTSHIGFICYEEWTIVRVETRFALWDKWYLMFEFILIVFQ